MFDNSRRATRMRSLLAGVALLGSASAAHAQAAVTAEQATGLEQQVQDWMQSLVGPHVPVPPHLFHITAEDDHYRFRIEIAGPIANSGYTVEGAPMTANAKPGADGVWTMDSLTLPSPLRISNPHPAKGAPGEYTLSIGQQSQHGTFDPTYTHPTAMEGDLRDYASTMNSSDSTQKSLIQHYIATSNSTPTTDGRVTVTSTVIGEGFTTQIGTADGTTVKLTAARMEGGAELRDVSPQAFGDISRNAAELIVLSQPAVAPAPVVTPAPVTLAPGAPKVDAPKPGTPKPPANKSATTKPAPAKPPVPPAVAPPVAASSSSMTPAQKDLARKLVIAVRDMASGGEEHVSLDGLAIDVGGHTGSLAKVKLTFALAAPDQKLQMQVGISMDGVDSPEVPPGIMHDYLPRHFSIAQHVSGVPSKDVIDLALHAIDADGDSSQENALQAQAMALMSKGPLQVGVDEMSLDMGPASLKGTALFSIPSPNDASGDAEFRLTGFDALMKDVNSNPMTKQGGAALIFLKGIAAQDRDALVWKLNYRDHKFTVNGNDLSGMMPGN